MPAHMHPLRETSNTGYVFTDAKRVDSSTKSDKYNKYMRRLATASSGWTEDKNAERDPYRLIAEGVGGGNPHNNMPPYFTVYMWKRIA